MSTRKNFDGKVRAGDGACEAKTGEKAQNGQTLPEVLQLLTAEELVKLT